MDDLNIVLTPQPQEEVEVGFYAGGAQTRTTMLDNGLSAVWTAGDELAVWAKNSSGSFILSKQIFKTYGIDGKQGYFTTTLSEPMPEGEYTYYCSYPAPLSVNGTMATFNIPAIQDGKVTGGADIMIADPVVEHPALTPVPDTVDHSGMSMKMNRMVHQFRFYVPETDTKLGDENIEKILLDFPKDVVGNVSLDLANPSASATMSNASKQVTLNLADPISKSNETNEEYDYACVAIAPAFFESGQLMNLKAYTENKIVYFNPVDLDPKVFPVDDQKPRYFLSGHSTPVKLNIKQIIDYPYSLTFTLAASNLGENPNSITLMAPDGCIWADTGSKIYTYSPGHVIALNEKFTIRFEYKDQFEKFKGKAVTVTYDSDNAVTTQTVTIPNTDDAKKNVNLTVPYLFYEDFSGIQSFNDGHDNPGVGGDSDTWTGINELSNNSLEGWYGTRIGGQKATSVRICCRYEAVKVLGIGSSAYYKGRIYTPPLSRIKEGKDVTIEVSFKHGSYRSERGTGIFGTGAKPDKSPILYFGINTQDEVTNPDASSGDIIDNITGLISGSGYANPTPSSLSPMVIKGEYLDKENGSYTNLPKTKTLTISGIDKYMRLGWILTTDNTASNTNANYWLYLDDIKVKIVKN